MAYFWLSQIGVSSKESRLKTQNKTSKDSYHTRRSKKNTQCVTNKIQLRVKYRWSLEERGDATRGHPQAQLLSLFGQQLGMSGHPQAQDILTTHSFIHRKITQNLKTSITQNSTKAFVRSVSIRKQITTISVVVNQFIFSSSIIYTVFQLFYCKNSSKKTIEPSKQTHNAKKTESIKNRTICSNLELDHTYVTPKILK